MSNLQQPSTSQQFRFKQIFLISLIASLSIGALIAILVFFWVISEKPSLSFY